MNYIYIFSGGYLALHFLTIIKAKSDDHFIIGGLIGRSTLSPMKERIVLQLRLARDSNPGSFVQWPALLFTEPLGLQMK